MLKQYHLEPVFGACDGSPEASRCRGVSKGGDGSSAAHGEAGGGGLGGEEGRGSGSPPVGGEEAGGRPSLDQPLGSVPEGSPAAADPSPGRYSRPNSPLRGEGVREEGSAAAAATASPAADSSLDRAPSQERARAPSPSASVSASPGGTKYRPTSPPLVRARQSPARRGESLPSSGTGEERLPQAGPAGASIRSERSQWRLAHLSLVPWQAAGVVACGAVPCGAWSWQKQEERPAQLTNVCGPHGCVSCLQLAPSTTRRGRGRRARP